MIHPTCLFPQINAAEARKVTNFEQEAVAVDRVLKQLLPISDKGRAEYYAAGGFEPEGGWDAAGEASWAKTTEKKAVERLALEAEIERLSQVVRG